MALPRSFIFRQLIQLSNIQPECYAGNLRVCLIFQDLWLPASKAHCEDKGKVAWATMQIRAFFSTCYICIETCSVNQMKHSPARHLPVVLLPLKKSQRPSTSQALGSHKVFSHATLSPILSYPTSAVPYSILSTLSTLLFLESDSQRLAWSL